MSVLVIVSCSCLTQQQCRDANRAQEEWFGNAASFQDKTGLFDPQPPLTNHEVAFGDVICRANSILSPQAQCMLHKAWRSRKCADILDTMQESI